MAEESVVKITTEDGDEFGVRVSQDQLGTILRLAAEIHENSEIDLRKAIDMLTEAGATVVFEPEEA